uniref:OBERON-like protein n=1 Tax=Araucaria cunninghamii TaxID=56994 RepID=A0A0D6QRP0_ARACU
MGTSSGASFQQQQPQQQMPPPRQLSRNAGLQTSLSLASSDVCGSADLRGPLSNPDHVRESPSESASSRETWPAEQTKGEGAAEHSRYEKEIEREKETEEESERPEQTVVHRVANSDRILLRDVAGERLDLIADRMREQPEEFLEDLKTELRLILEGTGGPQHREEFALLQKLVQRRADLTSETLIRAHRIQLEILVAIKTGIQAFLHPDISVTQTVLIEIFAHKRCRNIACQSPLPADDCNCEICSTKNGFCNLCMCVICSKFDFDVNTCRWVGCDTCSHWTHTDCAIRVGQISMGPSLKGVPGSKEMLFRCRACKRTSELLGWVKDIFQHCAHDWDREALMKEFDCVRRIFHGSEDAKGRKLFWKSEELLENLKTGADEATVCKVMQHFFQDLETEDVKNAEGEEGRMIAPQEACSRIVEVVQEAVRKMEAVADEKSRVFKKARIALEMCERELKDKSREVAELQYERQRKKQQIEELEAIVRLKQAEADMFQLKADEARREAERLQRIALAKSEKAEEEYASRYLKLRLNEAEAERRYLFEKIQLQEQSRLQPDSSQMLMLCKIQDLLKTVYNVPKIDSQSQGDHSGSAP